MKPVLIDRSLVGVKFRDENDKESGEKCGAEDSKGQISYSKPLFLYVCSLLQAGAAYVEIDFNTLVKLPRPSGAENFVYRIGRPEEFVVANAIDVPYVLVPLKFAYVIPKIEKPVILEVETGAADLETVLKVVLDNVDMTELAMLRVTGDFEPDVIAGVLRKYRTRTVTPIDFCPLNTGLNGLESAISAYRACADAVTVAFGDGDRFASLEEMLIALSVNYGIVVSPEYLEGICRLTVIDAGIDRERSGKPANMALMINKLISFSDIIRRVDADCPEKTHTPKVRYPLKPRPRKPAEKRLQQMNIEEIPAKIIAALPEVGGTDLFRVKRTLAKPGDVSLFEEEIKWLQ